MSATQHEAFEEFYARISAPRKGAIEASTDAAERERLIAADLSFEMKWRKACDKEVELAKYRTSALTEEEIKDRYRHDRVQKFPRLGHEHSTYKIVNGEAC